MEGISNNQFEEGGDFLKGIKDLIEIYEQKILSVKNKSSQPEKFNHLIDEIKAEGSVVVLLAENIKKSYEASLQNLLPEFKEKMSGLFEKSGVIADKLFEATVSQLDDKPFDVWQEKEKTFSEKIQKIEDISNNTENPVLGELVESLKKDYEDSMKSMYDSMQEKNERTLELYREFLLSSSKDISAQMKSLMEDKKLESFISTKTNQDYFKLLDDFNFKSNALVKKAEDLYFEEQAGLN